MVNHSNTQGDAVSKLVKGVKNVSTNANRKVQYLNFGEDDQMEIEGFIFNKVKAAIVWVLYILTLGILRLFFHWYPKLLLLATHSRCNLGKAEKVLITDNYNGKVSTSFVKNINTLRVQQHESYGKDIDNNIFLKKKEQDYKLLKFRLADGTNKETSKIRIIRCKKLTYVWDEDRKKFIKLGGLENGIKRSELHQFNGQSEEEQLIKRIVYGNNEINVPVQTILTLLLLEALTPFYIFQLFSLTVWLCENYYYYTVAIIVMSVGGITTSIIQTRTNQKRLKGTVTLAAKATICRGDGLYEEVPTTDLVPGDVIVIPNECEMQCDAVLLQGTCIVNESMLTGESVPVTKTPLPKNNTLYNVKEDANHTMFCGTKVIQTRCQGDSKVLAVVVRTGYLTTKGELVRSILYPPPADFKFDQDSYKFIIILAIIALLGFIYTVVSKISRHMAASDIAIKALDIITIVVPPALPAAMTVGKLYALNRLKDKKIFCINSRVINVSGSVDCLCFDKTGTLTEDELDMWGIVPVQNNQICEPQKHVKSMENNCALVRGMATCHSLTSIDGRICGDPLDVKMFESTHWIFEDRHALEIKQHHDTALLVVKPPQILSESTGQNDEIEIVKQFQFSSTLQRMSVITKTFDKHYFEVFCKGSPEMIISLSDPTTIPTDIHENLKEYTEQGYRVIAIATRTLDPHFSHKDIETLHREDVEYGLEFLGLIILENKLKPQTTEVIKTLKSANMKVVMITGDNIQTAVHVANECKIIDPDCKVIEVLASNPTRHEFASISYHVVSYPTWDKDVGEILSKNGGRIDVESPKQGKYCFIVTGTTWSNVVKYFPDLIPKIVAKGVVFARMSGVQKQQLVEELKNLGYYVAMCGDGANDCGALKAAHVGISLSEAESSVASPLTSQEANISCTPKVIKEGRAALVTSFGVFKMMLCYSLTEFVSVMILYTIDANLTSLEYLFIDIFLVLNFASTFGLTKAYEKLDRTPPMTSLLSFIPLCSIILFMLLTVVFQVLAFNYIQTFDWFTKFVYDPVNWNSFYCYENYAVYSVSMFQYITMAVVFSKGKPYRKALYTNWLFALSLFVMTLVCIYIMMYPAHWLSDTLELMVPPEYRARIVILLMALVNFLACIIVEDLFIEMFLAQYVVPKFGEVCKSKKRYLEVTRELDNDLAWPQIKEDVAHMGGIIDEEQNEQNNESVSVMGIVNNGFVQSESAENVVVTRC